MAKRRTGRKPAGVATGTVLQPTLPSIDDKFFDAQEKETSDTTILEDSGEETSAPSLHRQLSENTLDRTNRQDCGKHSPLERQLSMSSEECEDDWGRCTVLRPKFKRISPFKVVPGQPSEIERDATISDVAGVCWSRAGQALRKQSILKCDHAPWIWKHNLTQPLTEAPNFRRYGAAGGALPVFGVAQPTLDGCAEVLSAIREMEPGLDRVLWFTLRDELVIYINGRPYTIRNRSNPSDYAPLAGFQPWQLQELEETLKREVAQEATRNDGRVLLHSERMDQRGNRELYAYWEPVSEENIICQHELFKRLKDKHYPELFSARFPITDNSAPEEKEFDAFVRELVPELRAQRRCAVVFNCLMGQGRTTTGMVVSALLCQVVSLGEQAPNVECLPELQCSMDAPVVSDIMGQLPDGAFARRWVDSVMDDCGHLMNLRTILTDKRRMMARTREAMEWATLREKYVSFTERYIYLILFGQYVWAEIKHGAASFPRSPTGFQQYMRELHQTVSVYQRLEGLDQLGWERRSTACSKSSVSARRSESLRISAGNWDARWNGGSSWEGGWKSSKGGHDSKGGRDPNGGNDSKGGHDSTGGQHASRKFGTSEWPGDAGWRAGGNKSQQKGAGAGRNRGGNADVTGKGKYIERKVGLEGKGQHDDRKAHNVNLNSEMTSARPDLDDGHVNKACQDAQVEGGEVEHDEWSYTGNLASVPW